MKTPSLDFITLDQTHHLLHFLLRRYVGLLPSDVLFAFLRLLKLCDVQPKSWSYRRFPRSTREVLLISPGTTITLLNDLSCRVTNSPPSVFPPPRSRPSRVSRTGQAIKIPRLLVPSVGATRTASRAPRRRPTRLRAHRPRTSRLRARAGFRGIHRDPLIIPCPSTLPATAITPVQTRWAA